MAHAYIAKTNNFFKRIDSIGAEASVNLVVAVMKLYKQCLEVHILAMG